MMAGVRTVLTTEPLHINLLTDGNVDIKSAPYYTL